MSTLARYYHTSDANGKGLVAVWNERHMHEYFIKKPCLQNHTGLLSVLHNSSILLVYDEDKVQEDQLNNKRQEVLK